MRQILLFILTLNFFSASAQEYEWQKLATESYAGKQDDIFFINENKGWYINGYGKIFHTEDGGTTWQLQLEKKGTFFRCIAFVDSSTGFVGTVGTDYFPNVTDTIPLYKTINGGATWEPVVYSGSYVKGLCAIDIAKEQFINHGEIGFKYHVYCVGRVGSPANMLVSHDGGTTFQSQSMEAHCSALYDIKMFDKNNGFVAASIGADEGMHACILRTKDGGKNWSKVFESKRPFETCWKISFPSSKVGYGTIQSYVQDTNYATQYCVKTKNGGKKWKEKLICKEHKARPFGIGFIDEKVGYLGTTTSGYQTNDGGKHWHKVDMGKACNKIRILHKPDGSLYGYAIGVSVMKLKVQQ